MEIRTGSAGRGGGYRAERATFLSVHSVDLLPTVVFVLLQYRLVHDVVVVVCVVVRVA